LKIGIGIINIVNHKFLK